jgi:hypothetical protein
MAISCHRPLSPGRFAEPGREHRGEFPVRREIEFHRAAEMGEGLIYRAIRSCSSAIGVGSMKAVWTHPEVPKPEWFGTGLSEFYYGKRCIHSFGVKTMSSRTARACGVLGRLTVSLPLLDCGDPSPL